VLQGMTQEGTTVFFSSHVLEVVEKLCTRVAIIARGRIVGEGTLDDLRTGTRDQSLEDIFVHLVTGQAADDVFPSPPLEQDMPASPAPLASPFDHP